MRLEQQARETHQLLVRLQSLRGTRWEDLSFDRLAAIAKPFAEDQSTPFRLLKLTRLEAKLVSVGAERLLNDIQRRKPSPESWPDCFDYAWISSAIDELAIQDPEVKGFVGGTHNGYVGDFKKLDADRPRSPSNECGGPTH